MSRLDFSDDATRAAFEEGMGIEIKSTRLARPDQQMQFPTSRNVSETVIRRFREADWWAFGVFNVYEQLIAILRVDAKEMRPLIDEIDAKRLAAEADARKKELNNPKLSYSRIRRIATPIFFDDESYEDHTTKGGARRIAPKAPAPPIPASEVEAAESAPQEAPPELFDSRDA